MRKNMSALLKAVKDGDLQLVKSLLAEGVSLSEVSESSSSPLHAACERGDTTIINLLKVHGANPDVKDGRGETPLHKVIKTRNLKAFLAIVSMNPNLNAKDHYGNTPIHLTVLEGQFEMLEILIKKNVKVNLVNENHETALEMAEKYGDAKTAQLLKRSGGKKTMSMFSALIEACRTANILRKVSLFMVLSIYLSFIMACFFVQGIALLPVILGGTALVSGLLLVFMDRPYRRVKSLEAKLFNGEMTCAEYEAVLYRNELLVLDNDLLNELEFRLPINDNLVSSNTVNIDLENNQIH